MYLTAPDLRNFTSVSKLYYTLEPSFLEPFINPTVRPLRSGYSFRTVVVCMYLVGPYFGYDDGCVW